MKSYIKLPFLAIFFIAIFIVGFSNADAAKAETSKLNKVNTVDFVQQNSFREEGCKITITVDSDGKVVVKITCPIL
tara:strand:+ start:425 stop:652 length:228 start_codon:yes stop_codon:yes gene_type:complete